MKIRAVNQNTLRPKSLVQLLANVELGENYLSFFVTAGVPFHIYGKVAFVNSHSERESTA